MKRSDVKVWAAGDGVRVNPETGRYFEDRTDIFSDYPTGDYRSHNPVWDAARNQVTLHAARNEFVSFQLVLEPEGAVGRATVEFKRLTGPDGAKIADGSVALFRPWYVQVERSSHAYDAISLGPGWYPDALLPAPTGKPVVFDFAQEQIYISPPRHNQSMWVDVYVPRDRSEAPPGIYRGTVEVTWPGGKHEITVELTVWDFALPDEIHCRGDIYNTTLKMMHPELELKYYQMARRHRWDPGVAFYRPGLQVDGTQVTIDWREYDERLSKYLDGSAYTEKHGYWGPGYGVPISHVLLPFDCSKGEDSSRAWPAAMPAEGANPEFEAVWIEAGRQLKEHFDADPNWRRVEKIAFLDGLDESYNEEAYEKMAYYSDLLRRAMGRDWFKYRIDGGYQWSAMERLYPYVDLWVCTTAGFDADKTAHFRERGVEPWFYGQMIYPPGTGSYSGSNTFIDLDLLTCRGVGWATWKLRCGYCQWEFDWNADVAWTEAINYTNRNVAVNGSGMLFYRGDMVGSPDPIPSIRLKAHRRGFQDYEYFWLLREAGLGDEADELVNSIIHTTPFGQVNWGNIDIWRNNPEQWDAMRIRAGELLHEAYRSRG